VIRALTRSSRPLLFEPPATFSPGPFVHARGAMFIASNEQRSTLDAFYRTPGFSDALRVLTADEALSFVPVLRPEQTAIAVYQETAADVDVHGLHQAYIKGLRARGGSVVGDCAVRRVERNNGRWQLETSDGRRISGTVLINAAGAWADEIARVAHVLPIGLTPMRRTVALVDVASESGVGAWPFVMDVEETFYFKPDAGKLLVSPADETPSPPCDAQPDDLDVAIAVDRLERATTLTVQRVTHRWAGLRSFVADRSPVVGFDPSVDGFFWLAGQGGYGIQTAPAVARAAAALAMGHSIPADIVEHGISAANLSPARLRTSLGSERCCSFHAFQASDRPDREGVL